MRLQHYLLFVLLLAGAGCQTPGASDGDGDADADGDADTDPDCSEDPNWEGCNCDAVEPRTCYEGTPLTKNVGRCVSGIHHCVSGEWGPCTGYGMPQPETAAGLNGIDDDCNHFIDDGLCSVADSCGGGCCLETQVCSQGLCVDGGGDSDTDGDVDCTAVDENAQVCPYRYGLFECPSADMRVCNTGGGYSAKCYPEASCTECCTEGTCQPPSDCPYF